MQTPRTDFAQAIRAIATERRLDAEVILSTIKEAIIAAYRRDARERGEDAEEMEIVVVLDSVTGEAKLFSVEEGKKKEITPPGFGRIAAQTAKQVIHQKIREAEKSNVMDEFEGKVGNLISGMILRFDGSNVRVDLGRTEGLMPAEERTSVERLTPNQRLTFLLKEISEGLRGKQIVLSRSDPEFVQKLFEREVPEVKAGTVEIKKIAREPGIRTKIAVFSNASGVDPVGSCVGQRGIRVQTVTNELGGERVDIVPWTEDTAEFIKSALSPAEGLGVELNEKEKTAKITAPEDQLAVAIGKDGQNARLTAKLTGYRIEVEGDGEGVQDTDSQEPEEKEEKPKKKATKAKKAKAKAKTSKTDSEVVEEKTKKSKSGNNEKASKGKKEEVKPEKSKKREKESSDE